MITYMVRAVLAVRDGYTGRPIAKNSVRCVLDGQLVVPQFKDGGYVIFSNLQPGRHSLVLSGHKYRDEELELDTPETGWEELVVSLKPGPAYPFGGSFTKLTVTREKAKDEKARLWIASRSAAMELRAAQDLASAGDFEMKLYYRGFADTAPLHVPLLIADGHHTEICTITAYTDGTAQFQKPLRYGHKRGARLYPAQSYQFDKNGAIIAAFREPVSAILFSEDNGKAVEMELTEGENTAVI